MGQCRTLDAEVTIGCYDDDYSSCENTILPFYLEQLFFLYTCLPLFNYTSYS